MKKGNRKVKLLTAALAGAMVMTTAASVTASAQTSSDYTPTASASVNNSKAQKMQEIENMKALRNKKLDELRVLCRMQKNVSIMNIGGYHAKNVKLYGRKIVTANGNGQFVLGDWELIDKCDQSLSGIGLGGCKFTISGDYAAFAFSFDITGGTDFPFSGVFWNDTQNYGWTNLDINLSGTCRMADIDITVSNEKVVSERNCSAHSEWKPN